MEEVDESVGANIREKWDGCFEQPPTPTGDGAQSEDSKGSRGEQ